MKKKILVTCAFPYSNGDIHLGHILEHIYADIWVRYQKLIGNKIYFICADDSHGTAVLLKSININIDPNLMINNILLDHKNDFLKFNIFHDYYYKTHSKYNYIFLRNIIDKCFVKNIIYNKNILQYYDNKKNIFLPDRYIIGTCPKCLSKKQYGDNCVICGSIYNTLDLINPISLVSKNKPVLKYSNHLFLNLNIFKQKIINWINSINLQENVFNQLLSWLKNDLIDWNISRDSPYFGFKIPSKFIKDKYFYVWFDALLGYISTFYKFCKINNNFLFDKFWFNDSNYELYHFIGKDILYFHGILWPAILDILNFRKPTNIIVHGHVLINNYKMSKSYENFISVKKWLKYYDSDSLRYYFASLLSNNINDINLCLIEFVNKINSDIVNKFINICSRISRFLEIYFNNILSNKLWNENFYNLFVQKFDIICYYYLNFNYYKVIIEINILLDLVNKCITDNKPWLWTNNFKKLRNLHIFCTTIINIFKLISIYLMPIIPNIIKKIEFFLNTKLNWKNFDKPLLNHKILKYENIYNRIKLYNF